MEQVDFKGKRILITGASSGIGEACALTCSKAGANLILVARDLKRLNETKAQLSAGRHSIIACDITDYSQIESEISKDINENGKVSGFVHSAGVELTIPFSMSKPHHYEQMFAINSISGFEIARILAKPKNICLENGSSFVFISSIMGMVGTEGKVAYCASKGALIAGTRALALELAKKKIRVNCVSPAIVQTKMVESLFSTLPEVAVQSIKEMHPLGLGRPADIAQAVLFLLSNASSWITGSNLVVDGGYSIK